MTAQTRATLKTYFLTGLKPSQTQFANQIDSFLSLSDTAGQSITSDVSAQGNFDIRGNFTVSGATTLAATSASIPSAGDTSGKVATMKNFTQGANGTSYVFIDATSLSNVASFTFSGIPSGYDQYELRLTNVLNATNNANLEMQFGNPGIIASNYNYSGGSFRSDATVSAFVGVTVGFLALTGGGVSNTSIGVNGKFTITQLGAASTPTYNGMTNYNSSTTFFTDVIGGVYGGGTITATALKLLWSAGNHTSGKVAIYGVRNS